MATEVVVAIVGVVAALAGAMVGGIFALIGNERVLRGALLAGRVERQLAYVASLRAVKRELELDARLLKPISEIPLRTPLRHVALDRFLAGADGDIPDPVFDAAEVIARYNALVETSNALSQSGQTVPEALRRLLDHVAADAHGELTEASAAVANTTFGITDWVSQAGEKIREVEQLPLHRRLFFLLTNPSPLPPPPPGLPQ